VDNCKIEASTSYVFQLKKKVSHGMHQLYTYAKECKLLYTKILTCPEDYWHVPLAMRLNVSIECNTEKENLTKRKRLYPAIVTSSSAFIVITGYLTAAPKKAPEILWKMEKVEVSCGL
jgi:hypothetical protein